MSRSWLSQKLTFLWLAVGYGTVHVIVVAWGATIMEAVLPAWPIEHLQIANNGEPVITQYWRGSANTSPSYRRLDGTPFTELEIIRLKFESPASLARAIGEPASWDKRLDTLVDYRLPATNWYVVAAYDHPGTAYLQGYEQLSNRLIGYIGKNGFSSTRPETDQRFAIQPSAYGAFNGILVASQKPYAHASVYEPRGSYPNNQEIEFANAPADAVWLLSQGTIYEIHLSDRSVRTLSENHPDWHSLSRTVVNDGDRSLLQLVARSDSGVDLIVPGTETTKTIPLEFMPYMNESLYQLPDDKHLLVRSSHRDIQQGELQEEILWINAEGAIERRETADLANRSMSKTTMTAILMAGAPCPFVSLGAMLLAPAFVPASSTETLTYSGRLALFVSYGGPWILVSVLIGLVCAWACWRRERQVFQSRDLTWPILVGLGGWFGWMAYICLRPLPARLPNRQWLPVQPEANRPIGTEIFA